MPVICPKCARPVGHGDLDCVWCGHVFNRVSYENENGIRTRVAPSRASVATNVFIDYDTAFLDSRDWFKK